MGLSRYGKTSIICGGIIIGVILLLFSLVCPIAMIICGAIIDSTSDMAVIKGIAKFLWIFGIIIPSIVGVIIVIGLIIAAIFGIWLGIVILKGMGGIH